MMFETVTVCGVLIVILLLTLLASYNALMQLRQDVRSAWSKMDEQLKQRYQLVPQLLNIVQSAGGAAVEQLAVVSAAKNKAAVAFSPAQLAEAEAVLSAGIQQVLIAADQQPGLSSNPHYLALRQKLLTSDNQIAQASRRYNDQVDALNAAMSSFPCFWTAKMIGLQLQPMFGLSAVSGV